jgi:hypothetical protein
MTPGQKEMLASMAQPLNTIERANGYSLAMLDFIHVMEKMGDTLSKDQVHELLDSMWQMKEVRETTGYMPNLETLTQE